MAFNFGSIKVPKKESLITNPVEIFQKNKSKITDSSINDLWLGQGDALREWDEHRNDKDVAVVLNTGAGKTLIGLLIAQSLVNETKGKILYACSSIQLIEQTREKAEGYGLPVTTYFGGKFNNDLFFQGKAACLTTYQALFNGKSKFFREEIDALIFDDAHTAEGTIKNHFSLSIDRNADRELFNSITSLFKGYYQRIGRDTSFQELYEGVNKGVELLPPSEIKNNYTEIHRLLTQSGEIDSGGNLFAWEHLKDHLDLCSFFVSNGSIQITPAFLPISSLPYFGNETRRVYLTATMLGKDAFLRTFGRELSHVVKPKTTAGECERLILFPGQSLIHENELVETKKFIISKKVLILTPNKQRASQWTDIGYLPETAEAVQAISDFRNSNGYDKLILAGRYDGIDLPGETCRYMVLDGLPSGTSLFDKYLWSSLRLSNTLRSLVACRIVQSLGRISRGMSDYGVVIITGKKYVDWLKTPKNASSLPDFIQKQIQLGLQVTKSTYSMKGMEDATDTFMARDTEWAEFYENFMTECEGEKSEFDMDKLLTFARAEVKFSKSYWVREYDKAAKNLEAVLDEAFEFSAGLGAWYCLWIGYCMELLGDDKFHNLYKHAHGVSRVIPKHLPFNQDFSISKCTQQVSNLFNEFEYLGGSNVGSPKKMIKNLSMLDGNGSPNQIEEAIRYLGQYLGLDSTRPDNEHGAGPDNLWILDDLALAIEAKTSKRKV